MKRVLALSLSLFVLANAVAINQTQALSKPVKYGLKVAGGLTSAGISSVAALTSAASLAFALKGVSIAIARKDIVGAIMAEVYRGPAITLSVSSGIISLLAAGASVYSFKSAYDTASQE